VARSEEEGKVTMLAELKTLADAGCQFVRLARGDKRPVGAAWQTRSTGDVAAVSEWLAARANVGLLLGPASGVIDIEFDTPEGREQLAALGLLDADTPTWQSARGEHRLFRWEGWMPECGCRKLDRIEARIGGLAAQSVLPPSVHPTGASYKWLIRPGDAPVASLPRELFGEDLMWCDE
jgi:hypothetical protein